MGYIVTVTSGPDQTTAVSLSLELPDAVVEGRNLEPDYSHLKQEIDLVQHRDSPDIEDGVEYWENLENWCDETIHYLCTKHYAEDHNFWIDLHCLCQILKFNSLIHFECKIPKKKSKMIRKMSMSKMITLLWILDNKYYHLPP